MFGKDVELGVISLIPDSLMPSPRQDDMAVMQQPVFRRPADTPRPSDVILAAIRVDAGVQVTLARPLSRVGLIEFSHPDDPPERWRSGSPAAAGISELPSVTTRLGLGLASERSSSPFYSRLVVSLMSISTGSIRVSSSNRADASGIYDPHRALSCRPRRSELSRPGFDAVLIPWLWRLRGR